MSVHVADILPLQIVEDSISAKSVSGKTMVRMTMMQTKSVVGPTAP
jgi:hypothetical protein